MWQVYQQHTVSFRVKDFFATTFSFLPPDPHTFDLISYVPKWTKKGSPLTTHKRPACEGHPFGDCTVEYWVGKTALRCGAVYRVHCDSFERHSEHCRCYIKF